MPSNEVAKIAASVDGIEVAADALISVTEQISALLRLHAEDPPAILALADRLDAQKVELATAVLNHTPAPPPTPA